MSAEEEAPSEGALEPPPQPSPVVTAGSSPPGRGNHVVCQPGGTLPPAQAEPGASGNFLSCSPADLKPCGPASPRADTAALAAAAAADGAEPSPAESAVAPPAADHRPPTQTPAAAEYRPAAEAVPPEEHAPGAASAAAEARPGCFTGEPGSMADAALGFRDGAPSSQAESCQKGVIPAQQAPLSVKAATGLVLSDLTDDASPQYSTARAASPGLPEPHALQQSEVESSPRVRSHNAATAGLNPRVSDAAAQEGAAQPGGLVVDRLAQPASFGWWSH